MEEQALPAGLGREFLAANGRLALYSAGPLLVAKFVGFGEADFATPILQKFDAIAKGHQRVEVFLEMGRMVNYHSELRVRLTTHVSSRRSEIASAHVYTCSRMVAMGVSVADLALGQIITVHPTLERFREALDNAARNTRTPKLSSSVLAD